MGNSNSTVHFEIEFDPGAYLLVAGLVLVTAWGLSAASWTDGLWVLQFVALMGVLVGGALAYSQFELPTAALIAACYGLGWIGFLLGLTLPKSLTWHQRSLELLGRLLQFANQVVTGGTNKDTLMFVLVNSAVLWILGAGCVWYVLRYRNAWAGLLPGGAVLVVNLVYYNGQVPMQRFLAVYMVLALLLLARTTLRTREAAWRAGRVGYSPEIRFELWRAAIGAALVILLLAWFVPGAAANPRVAGMWQAVASPWQTVRATWQRMFASVYGTGPTAGDFYGTSLALGGAVNLTDRPVMDVRVLPGPHYYWRARTFDAYADGRWTSNGQVQIRLPANDRGLARPRQAAQRPVTATFYIQTPATTVLYGVPQPFAYSRDVTLEAAVNEADEFDVWAARATQFIPQGEAYTVLSVMSVANELQLREAGDAYPLDIRERYLTLPPTITERTRALAEQLAAGQTSDYDTAVAVQNYLREAITYTRDIPTPPTGQDPVDWVLFDQREGYCNYYASAMVVLLRAVNIPARLSVGFAQGAYDLDTGLYRVIESDAHAWPEVYFPGYGWVEFEPTASQPPIDRTVSVNAAAPEAGLNPGQPEPVEDPRQREESETAAEAERGLGRSWWLWAAVAVVVGLGGGALLGWRRQIALAGHSAATLAYARLEGAARWVGVQNSPAWTPRERGQALARHLRESQPEIEEITTAYEDEMYAQGEAGEGPLEQAWKRLEPAVWKGILRRAWQRLRRLE